MKASERLSFTYLGKAARGKAKAKTGIGKSDLPGLQGGARGNVTLSLMTKRTRLGSIPTPVKASESKADSSPDSAISPEQLQCKLDLAGSRTCQVQCTREGNRTSIWVQDSQIVGRRFKARMVEDVKQFHPELSLETL